MADKQLTSNVNVDGKWFGPSYPQNEATAEVLDQITNPAAFADAQPPGADLRTTAADFGVEEGTQPSLRTNDAFTFTPAPAPAEAEDRKQPVPEGPTVADVASGPDEADSGSTKTTSRSKSTPKSDGG